MHCNPQTEDGDGRGSLNVAGKRGKAGWLNRFTSHTKIARAISTKGERCSCNVFRVRVLQIENKSAVVDAQPLYNSNWRRTKQKEVALSAHQQVIHGTRLHPRGKNVPAAIVRFSCSSISQFMSVCRNADQTFGLRFVIVTFAIHMN